MTARAHVQFDLPMDGVRIALVRDIGGDRHIFQWADPVLARMADGAAEEPTQSWLRLKEGDARALYEALADYFGHSGHDARALRKDYDAERKRVDQFIQHLAGSPVTGGRAV